MIGPGISKALADGKRAAAKQPTTEAPLRFGRNEVFYFASLLALFVGLFVQYGAGVALIIIGALGVGISVATSFFVTWLSSKEK